jgi:putative ABC transport system ATP-binding protein
VPTSVTSHGGPLIELRDITKVYERRTASVAALTGITVAIGSGEYVAIMGPSGSGKSTLLSILGCLDRPSTGEYVLAGRSVGSLPDEALSRVRNVHFGFVFQSFHLIPELSILDNVMTPLLYGGGPPADWPRRAEACLARVGIAHRARHRPSELSGGEAQRAAIARALVMEPRVILADEPTGNLDTATGEEIASLLDALHREGRTIVLVTHNEALALRSQRMIRLRDGRIESEQTTAA